MRIFHVIAERLGEQLGDLPILIAVPGLHHLADKLNAALGVGEGAVLLEERRSGEEDMGVIGGLVEEQILDDDALHRCKAGRNMVGIGIGLEDVLALDIDALEGPIDRGIEHVGNAQTGLAIDLDAP